jgi:DNA-binding MarR family transcriptional regulator
MSRDRALHLWERISALLRDGLRRSVAGAGLEPVHVLALWYVSRANRFSDNPLAVSEFLGLSKGNVSQRLAVLERKGYLSKQSDPQDRRRLHLRLTWAGAAFLRAHYPPKVWPGRADFDRLEDDLDALLRAMTAANGQRTFGQCSTCRFHRRENGSPYCGLLQLPLRRADAGLLCREHEPKETSR